MKILGVSAFYHDSAAALVVDGHIVAAAQEERFTRKKHDAGFPEHAVAYCLKAAGITIADVDYVAFYDKPLIKFERLLETYLAFAPRGFESFRMAIPVWLKEKLFLKDLLKKEFKKLDKDFDGKKLKFAEHHFSHAASAFYPSPFENAAVLTLDGVGEWATTVAGTGKGNHLQIEKEINFPHSLGLLYSAFTYYTGFKVNSGEYKVMGLAPYGEPTFVQKIRDNLIDIKPDGSFRLNMEYFNYCVGLTMTNKKFDKLFGAPPRKAEDKLTQREMNLAASIQVITEEVVLKITRDLHERTGQKNLCLAGGVALNCVANGKILRDGRFENIWIQPAAGDAGGALGAALSIYHHMLDQPRTIAPTDHMQGSYLGPDFNDAEIEAELKQAGAVYHQLSRDEMLDKTSLALADEKAIGWFQGKMEYGPRALGGRSIIADARSPKMQSQLNLKIKFRESFRPFAPSVLAEDAAEWFDINQPSPYMLLVANVTSQHQKAMTAEQHQLFGIDKLNVPRSDIPAVTHVDYSARIQTVHRETNPAYHELITRFKNKTGCPVIVNTSFNVRGEPIVCTPTDAFRCFMGCGLDMLVVGNFIMHKSEQNPALLQDYKDAFELD